MITILLIIALLITLFMWFKYKISALVLSAWIAEQNYNEPQEADIQRLTKWVIEKLFHIR